jgi:acyl carrier protein
VITSEDRRILLMEVLAQKMEELGLSAPAEPGGMSPQTALDDLGLDSMHYIEVISDMEERLGVELPYSANDGTRMETVGDLMALLDGAFANPS